jgi:hypothetical protein
MNTGTVSVLKLHVILKIVFYKCNISCNITSNITRNITSNITRILHEILQLYYYSLLELWLFHLQLV